MAASSSRVTAALRCEPIVSSVTDARRVEMLQLVVLLVLDGVFYFFVIPTGIVDPDGFGIDEGLPPSFSARLVAVLAAMLLIGRLVRLLLMGAPRTDVGARTPESEANTAPVNISPRSVTGIAVALLFASGLTPYLGFHLAGAILVLVLLVVMGERHPAKIVAFPAIVMLMVWLLFEQLLSIRLPVGALFA